MNELTINLQSKSNIPLYEQIYSYIKKDIQSGRIQSGEKLPSTRSLSRYLEVSRSTVELAYEQLLSEGYVESEPYRGFFVAQIEELYQLKQSPKRIPGGSVREEKRYSYDFTPNGVDLNSFPYNAWRKLSRDCLMDDRAEMFRLGEPQGEYGLREAICDYLHQARGVNCQPEQIIVGAGNDYLLMLLTTVIGHEHKVALENPTYKQAYRLFKNLSYEVCTVDMDSRGMDITKLTESNADIAFVMPSHQYPLGIVMPIKRRLALLKWANEQEGRYIIEDDYDSEFRYKGKPIPALQGYDSCDKVIYMGTFSKSIAPAIRMSYMVLPKSLLVLYQEKSSFLNSTVSKVDQLILQKFIEEGYYERHLNKTRALYKSRHDTLLGCLKSLQDRCVISGENAGVHLLLHFHNHMAEDELTARAAQKGVRVYGLTEYYIEPQVGKQATILLGYANMNEEKIQEAVRILDEAWK
ncbi:PLP-dependent aminotransferase family protein [Muricomes sp. OA1]|uniref:PLP-dependent aminotransferase family protein n=1 Tax=Hungatella hathewayi TaxID=154046 RepID=A0A3E2WJT4_9FIRM|nr:MULTISPECIES: PLP-dependent aminotransferase family protein [Clostridia]MCH1974248.1 PLP-dependent aminotransferase family protein [Muricomes sp. OA1]MRM90314.1 PLP-dependent aminotransferase family protein [Faecalicatena contorta]RGC27333.1 PLP-dependent aminotransferase family protein [Hungatella hathewayi]GKH33023.1 GntR family transcriptional regulator [Faecalicatena contorta]